MTADKLVFRIRIRMDPDTAHKFCKIFTKTLERSEKFWNFSYPNLLFFGLKVTKVMNSLDPDQESNCWIRIHKNTQISYPIVVAT